MSNLGDLVLEHTPKIEPPRNIREEFLNMRNQSMEIPDLHGAYYKMTHVVAKVLKGVIIYFYFFMFHS